MQSTVDHLKQGVLRVVANGYHGRTDYAATNSVTWSEQPDGSYKFEMMIQFDGEPEDYLHGTLKGRHIKFTRTRVKMLIQEYEGYLFGRPDPKGRVEMAGVFSHNGTQGYAWYGYTEPE
jgi:hypothetical protein